MSAPLRCVPDDWDKPTVSLIDTLLDSLAHKHAVRIPLAIESGSRAWGFPSPDSDYDCRFVYVRRIDDYLTPWQRRDVIETPLIGDLDVNGWDLGKALKLLLKGNAVIVEWLNSPFVYRGDPEFRAAFLDFAHQHSDRDRVARHYLHLGERQRQVYFPDGEDVPLKKLFYALRPAAALRWLRVHPDAKVVPMHFPTLMRECNPSPEMAALVADLIAQKAVTRELGKAPLPAIITDFVDREFETARETFPARSSLTDEAVADAETFFRTWVYRLAS